MGKADIIITGGSEASVNEAGVGGFNAIKHFLLVSPDKASRPFDKDRDGFVGEDAGTLILEEYEHAVKEVLKFMLMIGGGLSADAHHITAPHPRQGKKSNANALEDAQMKPEEVSYINVHGTST